MVCTSLGSQLRPLFYFLCSILLVHRVLLLKASYMSIISYDNMNQKMKKNVVLDILATPYAEGKKINTLSTYEFLSEILQS